MLEKPTDSQKSAYESESHGANRTANNNALTRMPTQAELRHAICERIDVEQEVTVAIVVTDVARRSGLPESAIKIEIDRLEAHGLLYRDGDGSDAEVRLP